MIINQRDAAHKKWLNERWEYFRKLGEKRNEEKLRIIDDIIAKHKIWLGFKGGDAFVRESKAFLNRKHKCGDDDGIVFSNQVRTAPLFNGGVNELTSFALRSTKQ